MVISAELSQRWRNLANVGLEQDLDVILVYLDEYNMADGYYFTNIWTQFERGFVAITAATAEVCLLVGPETAHYVMTHEPDLPYHIVSLFQAWGAGYPNTEWRDAADVLSQLGGNTAPRIGIVGSAFLPVTLFQALTEIAEDIVDLTATVHRARQIKSASEITNVKMAYQIADAGLQAMLNALTAARRQQKSLPRSHKISDLLPEREMGSTNKVGMTETELAGLGEAAMRTAGAEGYAYSTILTAQARTNSVFGRPKKKPIADGSMLMIGISPKYNGYCASLGIPVTFGTVSKDQQRYIQDTLAVYRSVEAQLAPGKMSSDIYQHSRQELERYQLEKYQIYGAVHSCGLLEAEAPFLSSDPNWELMPGMVLLIDLAIFHPLYWGIRWESGYLITEREAEPLSGYFDQASEIVLRQAARGMQ